MANEERRLKAGQHGRRDPIMGALREQSTHYAAATRITVYERLGLNKPGFWADHQQRKLEQNETDENYEAPMPKWLPKTMDYESQDWSKYEPTPARKININQLRIQETRPGPGKPTGNTRRQLNKQMLQVTANNWKYIGKAHPMLTMSSSDMLAAEKYRTHYDLAQLYGEALRKDPMTSITRVAQQYYFDKRSAAHVAETGQAMQRDGEPTQFEKMTGILQKKKKKAKGNTGGVTVLEKQKTSSKSGINYGTKNMLKGPQKTQLNVHANSYASTYPYPNF